MNQRTVNKLLRHGWEEKWLRDVQANFHSKRKGKYKMRITDIEDLSQEPETGIYIDTTFFDNEEELSIIHYFFEGFAYVMTVAETGEVIGKGVIDGAPFDEVEDYEETSWHWQHDKVKAMFGERTW